MAKVSDSQRMPASRTPSDGPLTGTDSDGGDPPAEGAMGVDMHPFVRCALADRHTTPLIQAQNPRPSIQLDSGMGAT